MLLFLVFVLCALFTVLIGSRVYENINVRSDANYTGNTALSYIANKVRQGDRAGMVNVADVDGIQVLEMKQEIGIQNTSHGFTGTMEASGSCLQTHPAVWGLRTVWRF